MLSYSQFTRLPPPVLPPACVPMHCPPYSLTSLTCVTLQVDGIVRQRRKPVLWPFSPSKIARLRAADKSAANLRVEAAWSDIPAGQRTAEVFAILPCRARLSNPTPFDSSAHLSHAALYWSRPVTVSTVLLYQEKRLARSRSLLTTKRNQRARLDETRALPSRREEKGHSVESDSGEDRVRASRERVDSEQYRERAV
jgi:hypothetical protein